MKCAFFALALALLVSGCSTMMTHTKVVAIDYDEGDLQRVGKAKTYHWSLPGNSQLNPYNNQDLYLSLVKADIDTQLAAKGYKLVTKGGDLEVSFLMLYKDGATTSVVDSYFGTNRAPERKIIRAVKKMPTPGYEVGTLVVDAEDANDHESLWRGAVSSRVNRDLPFESQKKRITKAVNLLLTDFPASK